MTMQKPVNPNATKEAVALLNFLQETAGRSIITGQHTQTNEMEELAYIREVTGMMPKLLGFELLSYSSNINEKDSSEECLTEVRENRDTLSTAMRMAKETDVILTFTFHWFSPLGGRDKSFYAENTDFDAEKVLAPGTEERIAFFRDLDVIAEELLKFQEERIPILWRPFHEAEGNWFWWGAKGPAVAKELYLLMYRYYIEEKHLNNLLWVWNCPLREGYPGDDHVDVISMDVYLPEYQKTDYKAEYEKLIRNTSANKVAALAEVGYLPDMELLSEDKIPWAYFMTWSKEFCIGEQYNTRSALKSVYDSSYSLKN